MSTIVTFGEIMARISPPAFLRFRQAIPGEVNMTFGGAEANVAASICQLGGTARFVTALPDNDIAYACIAHLKSHGIDTRFITQTAAGRLGIYFLETGANQRPSKVTYDRADSSIALTPPTAYDWPAIFKDAKWLHTSGITPAVSKNAADATFQAVKTARQNNLTVSCDLNFRKKLWRWNPDLSPRELAEKTMRSILPFVDLVIANEEDASDVLSIHPENTDIESGKLAIDKYPDVARKIAAQFPNVARVAITLRQSLSATHNNWGAMLYDVKTDSAHFAPLSDNRYTPYEIKNIVDRVGAGDSFAAALIFALTTSDLAAPEKAIAFAAAASCLAHSTYGDPNYSSRTEVESLAKGSVTGRVQR